MTLVKYSSASYIMPVLAIAGLFQNRYKNEADLSQLLFSPLGGAIVLQEKKKAWLQRKLYLCFYFHLVSGLCGSGSKFILGSIDVSVMSVLLLTLFIIILQSSCFSLEYVSVPNALHVTIL